MDYEKRRHHGKVRLLIYFDEAQVFVPSKLEVFETDDAAEQSTRTDKGTVQSTVAVDVMKQQPTETDTMLDKQAKPNTLSSIARISAPFVHKKERSLLDALRSAINELRPFDLLALFLSTNPLLSALAPSKDKLRPPRSSQDSLPSMVPFVELPFDIRYGGQPLACENEHTLDEVCEVAFMVKFGRATSVSVCLWRLRSACFFLLGGMRAGSVGTRLSGTISLISHASYFGEAKVLAPMTRRLWHFQSDFSLTSSLGENAVCKRCNDWCKITCASCFLSQIIAHICELVHHRSRSLQRLLQGSCRKMTLVPRHCQRKWKELG